MKNILRSGAVLAMVLGLAGCGSKADGALNEFKALKDKMCACKDKECAQKVTEEMAKMGEKHKDTKATEAQMKAAAAITEEFTKCMTKAMSGGEAPAAPAPATP